MIKIVARFALGGALLTFFATGIPPSHAQTSSDRSAAELMDLVMWSREPIGGPFALIDHNHAPRTDKDFRGKLMLVYFGFTYCPDICPADLQSIGQAMDKLGEMGERVQPLFVTVDPERDTAEHLSQYVQLFHPRLIGLTGDAAAVHAAAKAYRVYYAKIPLRGGDYTVDHSAFIYLMRANGEFLGFLPPGTDADRIAQAIRGQLAAVH